MPVMLHGGKRRRGGTGDTGAKTARLAAMPGRGLFFPFTLR